VINYGISYDRITSYLE